MCLDKQWQEWAGAWMEKRALHVTAIGIGYMLKGDRGASNTDPFATNATVNNHWIRSGDHLMVLVPDAGDVMRYLPIRTPVAPGSCGRAHRTHI